MSNNKFYYNKYLKYKKKYTELNKLRGGMSTATSAPGSLERSQGSSERSQGSSEKRQGSSEKRQGSSEKRQGSSEKRQGSSEKRQGLSGTASASKLDDNLELGIVGHYNIDTYEFRKGWDCKMSNKNKNIRFCTSRVLRFEYEILNKDESLQNLDNQHEISKQFKQIVVKIKDAEYIIVMNMFMEPTNQRLLKNYTDYYNNKEHIHELELLVINLNLSDWYSKVIDDLIIKARNPTKLDNIYHILYMQTYEGFKLRVYKGNYKPQKPKFQTAYKAFQNVKNEWAKNGIPYKHDIEQAMEWGFIKSNKLEINEDAWNAFKSTLQKLKDAKEVDDVQLSKARNAGLLKNYKGNPIDTPLAKKIATKFIQKEDLISKSLTIEPHPLSFSAVDNAKRAGLIHPLTTPIRSGNTISRGDPYYETVVNVTKSWTRGNAPEFDDLKNLGKNEYLNIDLKNIYNGIDVFNLIKQAWAQRWGNVGDDAQEAYEDPGRVWDVHIELARRGGYLPPVSAQAQSWELSDLAGNEHKYANTYNNFPPISYQRRWAKELGYLAPSTHPIIMTPNDDELMRGQPGASLDEAEIKNLIKLRTSWATGQLPKQEVILAIEGYDPPGHYIVNQARRDDYNNVPNQVALGDRRSAITSFNRIKKAWNNLTIPTQIDLINAKYYGLIPFTINDCSETNIDNINDYNTSKTECELIIGKLTHLYKINNIRINKKGLQLAKDAGFIHQVENRNTINVPIGTLEEYTNFQKEERVRAEAASAREAAASAIAIRNTLRSPASITPPARPRPPPPPAPPVMGAPPGLAAPPGPGAGQGADQVLGVQ